jgi:hypothetical protein
MVLEVAGRAVEVSSPDKVFFAERGDTKLDLVQYYLDLEGPVLAAMGGRPVMGPGFAIMEQRLRQAEGDPTLLMRNQFRMGEMELMRQTGGRLRESRPW